MPTHAFEIEAAHKYSPVQVMKDYKLVIAKYKKEIPKIKAARVEEKKRLKELMLKGGMDMEGMDGEEEDD
jgi:hypothetical protein